MDDRKSRLRREARIRVREILRGEGERERAEAEIARRLVRLPELAVARVVLLYAALPGEVPTDVVAAEIRRKGIGLVYPRCLPVGRTMTLHHVASDADLEPSGRYGIREPLEICPVVEVGDIDLALVPGLAWDRSGHRLGRGAGYYDRLLGSPEWRGFRCGLFFAAQEVDSIPADPWDAPLDAIVTEEEIWRGLRSATLPDLPA